MNTNVWPTLIKAVLIWFSSNICIGLFGKYAEVSISTTDRIAIFIVICAGMYFRAKTNFDKYEAFVIFVAMTVAQFILWAYK